VKRRRAKIVRRIGARACANQYVRYREVVVINGPMKRGSAIPLLRIHVGVMFEQYPHRRGILISYGLNETQVRC
jgi:hypothetical protein